MVVLGGVALQVAATSLYLRLDTLGLHVYGIRLLDGMAMTMWYTALFTYAADLVPASRRTEGLAIFGISGLIPIGLAAVAGDVILAYASYRELFAEFLLNAVIDSLPDSRRDLLEEELIELQLLDYCRAALERQEPK